MTCRITLVLFIFLPQLIKAQSQEFSLFTDVDSLNGEVSVDREIIKKLNSEKWDRFESLVIAPPHLSKSNNPKIPLSFDRLDFLSPGYRLQYEDFFGTMAPYVYSHSERGNNLINIVTYPEPVINYHSAEGNYILSHYESKSKWTHQLSNTSIEGFCNTQDEPIEVIYKSNDPKSQNDSIPSVTVYLEIDYHTYVDFNEDLQAINDWAILLFSEVAAVYAVDDIDVILEEVFIWDEEDIYDLDNGTLAVLDQFNTKILSASPRADAHLLLSTRYIAGVANLESLCRHHDPANPIAAVGIATGLEMTTSFNPDYNWSTYVVSHELGHILGSRHTHACVWIDGTKALDDCATSEGSCNRGNRPGPGEGTIMSYCHRWQSIGINFTNGLGDEPSALIRTYIKNNSCALPTMCEIGSPCDDGDSCTINDRITDECTCIGNIVDFNFNNICDLDEACPDTLFVDIVNETTEGYIADHSIESQVNISNNQSISFSVSGQIILHQGFEVDLGGQLECLQYGCSSDE